jgi:hypothetical protein
VHQEFGAKQNRQCDQEPNVSLDIAQKGDLDAPAMCVSFDQRQEQERQPREYRDGQNPPAKKFQTIPGEMRAPE